MTPFLLDAHADTPQRFLDEAWNFTDPIGRGHLNLASARAGGLSAQVFALWVDPTEYPANPSRRAFALLEAVHQQVRRAPAELQLCLTAADLEQAHQAGRFAILLSVEGGHSIESDLALLRLFYQRGVRSMTLTWSHSVGWADSCGDLEEPAIPHVQGLSAFGLQVIAEMNALGMLIDVSHVSDATLAAVLQASKAPVIASHSCARALTHAPRNLTDDQILAIGNSGGLVMLNFFPAFLDESWRQTWNALKPERDRAQHLAAAPFRTTGRPVPFAISDAVDRNFAARIPRVPLSALADHFDHILGLVGPDHVGLGSDFDGIPATPQGLESASAIPKLFRTLQDRGHTAEALDKVRGTNFLRVLRAVEQHAAQNAPA